MYYKDRDAATTYYLISRAELAHKNWKVEIPKLQLEISVHVVDKGRQFVIANSSVVVVY